MFRCERCSSQFSATHAATLENCPRCQIRDRVASPLVFKPFRFPEEGESKPADGQMPAIADGESAAGVGASEAYSPPNTWT
jgi:hypothetical protein